jgi:amino acid transporter
LSLFDAVAVVVGTIIGSGIFLLPSSIAAEVDSLGIVLLVWAVGGHLMMLDQPNQFVEGLVEVLT